MTVPKVSQPKEIPEEKTINLEIPKETEKKTKKPSTTKKLTYNPNATNFIEKVPDESELKEELPSDVPENNCVLIAGEKKEIKPTKLKYFRNKAASGYNLIKAIPIHELLTYGKGVLDAERDADQLLYDFLVAVFDDSTFVRKHYDDLDPDIVEQILKIFGRINHIDEKEEAVRKNREAQAQATR